jgi:hypothetical protein
MPERKASNTSLEKRAKRQVRALEGNVRKTLKALDKAYPDTHQCDEILSQHQQRAVKILEWGRKPPPPLCPVCGKPLPQKPGEVWTSNPFLKLLWSCFVLLICTTVAWLWEWWALLVPVAGWIISLNFIYTITVPFFMFLAVVLILSVFRL